MRKLEQVEVKYCDICGERESEARSIYLCWKCGRDVCDWHHHLVSVEGGIEKCRTYLCDTCRDELEQKLSQLFDYYSRERPK